MSAEQNGARFFDRGNHDVGWASSVVRRQRAVGRLTILDVTTSDRTLQSFLSGLDRDQLRVQLDGALGMTFRFAWASGYANGPSVRIQGVLQDA